MHTSYWEYLHYYYKNFKQIQDGQSEALLWISHELTHL